MSKGIRIFLYVLLVLAAAGATDRYLWAHFRSKLAPEEDKGPVIMQLTKDNYFYELGNSAAPTKVIAYLPDEDCNDDAIQALVNLAKQSPEDVYVKLVRMYTPEGHELAYQAGTPGCAQYQINGSRSCTVTRPDGSVAKVSFDHSPGGGGWPVEDLTLAVQQAIAKAKQSAPPTQTAGTQPKTPETAQALKPEGQPAVAPPEGKVYSTHATVADPDSSNCLVGRLMGKKSSAEWGSQTAPTQVVGYVPDSDCQEASIAYLVDTAEKNPSGLHLRLVRMFTTEGQKITLSEHGKICSAYLINGSSTVTVTRADGTVKQATFRSGPGDLWTDDDLKLAVEQAMAKQAAK